MRVYPFVLRDVRFTDSSGQIELPMRVLLAYLALLFIVPSVSAIGPLLLFLLPPSSRRSVNIRLKFASAVVGALSAVFCTATLFRWLRVEVTLATSIVLLSWFLLNDVGRVLKSEGDLRVFRLTHLFGDCTGVIIGFLLLWSGPFR